MTNAGEGAQPRVPRRKLGAGSKAVPHESSESSRSQRLRNFSRRRGGRRRRRVTGRSGARVMVLPAWRAADWKAVKGQDAHLRMARRYGAPYFIAEAPRRGEGKSGRESSFLAAEAARNDKRGRGRPRHTKKKKRDGMSRFVSSYKFRI